MTVKVTKLPTCGLNDVRLDFEVAGDVFPEHTHPDAANNHITIVARGSFRCLGDVDIAGQVFGAGTQIDWPVGISHGFVAVEDKTVLINLSKARQE